MTRSFTEINKAIAWQLNESIGKDRFDMWFGGKDAFAIQDGQVVVTAIDEFSLSCIRQQFEAALRDAVQAVLGSGTVVKFSVAEPPPAAKTQNRLFTEEQLSIADPGSDSTRARPPAGRAAGRRRLSAASADSGDRQLSFAESTAEATASFKPSLSLESFQFGSQNRLLETAIREMLAAPGKFNPLVLHGPSGCGKSHLVQAIVGAARKTGRYRRCVSLTSEQFTSGFIEALQSRQLTGFRGKFRNLDLLAIDDIQFLSGKQATIVEFQSTVEALLRNGKQIVVTADRPPFEANFSCDQLVTRLSCGLTCPIGYPDLEGRLQIVENLAASRGLSLSPAVQRLICERMGRDVRRLSGAVNRLRAASMALNQAVDPRSAEELLADMFHSQTPVVSLARIERVVCDLCGIDADDLKSSKRIKRVSTARMLAMWLSRKYTSAGLAEIGKYYGGRSHSTVVAAEKKINGLLQTDSQIELKAHQTTMTAAVGRLRHSLEVG